MAKTATFACPDCGRRFNIVPEIDGFQEFKSSQRWQADIVQPTLKTAEKPQHPSLLLRFVNLPLQQSVISGLFAALVLTGIVIGLGSLFNWELSPLDVALVYVGIAVFVCVVIWFVLFLVDRFTLLLNEIVEVLERVFGVDINRDGMIGKQEPPEPTTTIVDFMDHDKRQGKKVELPVNDRIMKEVAHAMLRNGDRYNFSRRDMRAATSISDAQFEALQKKFLAAGWAVYKVKDKPNSGVILLAAGKHVLKQYL